jgi:hypothetical protein
MGAGGERNRSVASTSAPTMRPLAPPNVRTLPEHHGPTRGIRHYRFCDWRCTRARAESAEAMLKVAEAPLGFRVRSQPGQTGIEEHHSFLLQSITGRVVFRDSALPADGNECAVLGPVTGIALLERTPSHPDGIGIGLRAEYQGAQSPGLTNFKCAEDVRSLGYIRGRRSLTMRELRNPVQPR